MRGREGGSLWGVSCSGRKSFGGAARLQGGGSSWEEREVVRRGGCGWVRIGGIYWKKRKRWLGGQICVLGDHFDMMCTTKTTTQTQNIILKICWYKTNQNRKGYKNYL